MTTTTLLPPLPHVQPQPQEQPRQQLFEPPQLPPQEDCEDRDNAFDFDDGLERRGGEGEEGNN